MGQCASTQDNVALAASRYSDKLLDDIESIARSKGMEGVKEAYTLPELYKKGQLHDGGMDFFLLTIFNQCDETDNPRSIPESMKKRDKNGKNKNIHGLVRCLLGKSTEIPIFLLRSILDPAGAMQDLANVFRSGRGHHEVSEADGSRMKFVKNEFENWGQNIKTNSILTFVPTTKGGICNLVKWAKSKSLKVQAAGFCHSWCNITVDNNQQVRVSLLPLKQVETIPKFDLSIYPKNELQGIELLKETVEEDGVQKRLCKIGAGTTNEQFLEWIVENSRDKRNKTWKNWWTPS